MTTWLALGPARASEPDAKIRGVVRPITHSSISVDLPARVARINALEGERFRKGDVNDPEAKAVVDEIEHIIADPQFEGRSIGVVTLLGTAQAALIQISPRRRQPMKTKRKREKPGKRQRNKQYL